MVKESLKKLLDKYPYFLNKNVTSNFYRVVNVQNEGFKQLYQSLVDIYESFHLNKKINVWKEQADPYEYNIKFHANYPNIKTVNIYKNDVLIHTTEYDSEDSESTFEYTYNHDTRNDLLFTKVDDEEEIIQDLTPAQQELMDRLLFWSIEKASDENHVYLVNIKAKYHRLKKVTLQKNNTIILDETFTDKPTTTIYEYSYENTYIPPEPEYDEDGNIIEPSTYDDEFSVTIETYNGETVTKILPADEADYIPEDEFLLEVETYDEYIFRKGFPENDTFQNNEYDHDYSLDDIGALNNIPRKEYIEIDTLEEYYHSEPPFNNRRTEDDYHYMKRIIEYNLRLFNTPAPVLEIWKLYGLEDVSMVNREHLLLKMFDITKHDYHMETRTHPCDATKKYNTMVVDGWIPEAWEHKDRFFLEGNKLGTYFFATANTVRPVKKQSVTFNFQVLNSLAENISGNYLIDIFLNDTPVHVNCSNCSQWICPADILDEVEDNVFKFICKTSEKTVGEVEIIISVRGCNDADFFVNEATGDDNNSGTSREAPFKTLGKALTKINGVYDLIALIGTQHTNTILPVPETCTIIGCNNANLINTTTSKFFNVEQDKTLTVQDITFTTDEPFTSLVDTINYTNNNLTTEVETALMYNMDYALPLSDLNEEVFIKNLALNSNTGLLTWEEITKDELPTQASYDGIVTNLKLTDDFYYIEHNTTETTNKNYDSNYLYYSDRLDLLNATSYINNSLTDLKEDGLLDYTEYGSEIVYETKTHDIDEFQYQHVKGTQGTFTRRSASWILGSLEVNLRITNPVVNQFITLQTNDGFYARYKVSAINGNNITFVEPAGTAPQVNRAYVQAVEGVTEYVEITLERLVTSTGFVNIGSTDRLYLDW